MLRRKTTIAFALIGIGTVLGFLSGVAPGYFVKSYGLFAIVGAFLLFILLLFSLAAVIYEYLHKKTIIFNARNGLGIFHQELSRPEKVILSLINLILLFTGGFFGVICELLLKAISAPIAVHFVIGSIVVAILLVVLVIMLILALKKDKTVKANHLPVALTTVQNEPRNTISQMNPSYSRDLNDNRLKPSWQNPPVNNSKTPSTVQREYQKLLNPSPRFYLNEKVFVNDDEMAQIIGIDGLGIYRIQYIDTGRIDYKSGAELRKALPLIE